MRLAWFREFPLSAARPFDDTASAIIELGHTHEIDVYTPENVNHFPATHARAPYDLPVYELPACPWRSFTRAIEERHPGLAVSIAERPVGWGIDSIAAAIRPVTATTSTLRCGVFGHHVREVAEKAIQRARELGASIELITTEPEQVIDHADLVLALGMPSNGEPVTPALAALAARRPVVIFDLQATALWPSYDPQTWSIRGPAHSDGAAMVSIDLRDREHSLLLAIRRLSNNAAFREQLAETGFEWWRRHATLRHAVQEWERLIASAAASHA